MEINGRAKTPTFALINCTIWRETFTTAARRDTGGVAALFMYTFVFTSPPCCWSDATSAEVAARCAVALLMSCAYVNKYRGAI